MSAVPRPRFRYFSYHDALPRYTYGLFSLMIVIGVVLVLANKPPLYLIGGWFIVLSSFAVTDREIEIDTHRRELVTRWMPCRIFTIWKTTEPLDHYQAITTRRTSNGGRGSIHSPHELEWLALVRLSGRFRWIQWCAAMKGEVSTTGQAAMLRLMDATGLPYQTYPNRMFNRPAPVARTDA